MQNINTIKNKIQFQNIIKLLSKSKFDFNDLNNNDALIYSIYEVKRKDRFRHWYYIYIGTDKENNLYFIHYKRDFKAFKNSLEMKLFLANKYKISENEVLCLEKYELDKQYGKLFIKGEGKFINITTGENTNIKNLYFGYVVSNNEFEKTYLT